jgi:hypothetical protein
VRIVLFGFDPTGFSTKSYTSLGWDEGSARIVAVSLGAPTVAAAQPVPLEGNVTACPVC